MQISFVQKLEVTFILFVLRVIYAVDVLTGDIFETFVKLTLRALTYAFAVSYIFLLVYSFKTNFLRNVAFGYQSTFLFNNLTSKANDANVLGAASVKKDLPILIAKVAIPEISSKAVLIVDKINNKTLYEKDSNERLAPASTTKLMTALVALDLYSLNDTVTISKKCTQVDSTKAGLPEGTSYRVKDLLNAMLIASSGDVACAFSEGKVQPDEFTYLMNQKASKLGMRSTLFTNPIGLDDDNKANFSSAHDLYKLASAAMDDKLIRQIVRTKEYTISSVDDKYIGKLETTNKLLSEIPQTIGIKTGTTTDAGQVLIYEYKDDIKDLVIIVMGSEDRFTDVRALLSWIFQSYSWK